MSRVGRLRRLPGRLALALAAGLALAGTPAAAEPDIWQCVPFARLFSGVELFGDAFTWWDQAAGRYGRGQTPVAGSVLVFRPSPAMPKGHVAVVQQVLTDRIIQVTHANWSPVDGRRGQVETAVTVADVSPAGDWSAVKVWYRPAADLGSTVYPTFGFVYGPAAAGPKSAVTALNAAARAALSAQIKDALR